jgi:hypothetical protein
MPPDNLETRTCTGDGAGHVVLSQNAVATAANPDAYLVQTIVEPGVASKLVLATASGSITTLASTR